GPPLHAVVSPLSPPLLLDRPAGPPAGDGRPLCAVPEPALPGRGGGRLGGLPAHHRLGGSRGPGHLAGLPAGAGVRRGAGPGSKLRAGIPRLLRARTPFPSLAAGPAEAT